jgi:hypothetical protein
VFRIVERCLSPENRTTTTVRQATAAGLAPDARRTLKSLLK